MRRPTATLLTTTNDNFHADKKQGRGNAIPRGFNVQDSPLSEGVKSFLGGVVIELSENKLRLLGGSNMTQSNNADSDWQHIKDTALEVVSKRLL